VELRGERRRLSFRALDVEQIGYVYEGLLELEVRTATEPVLGLHAQGRKGQRLLGLADALAAVDALEEWTATTYLGEKKLTATRRTSANRWLARVGAGLAAASGPKAKRDSLFRQLQPGVWGAVNGDLDRWRGLLQAGNPPGKEDRRPLHWPLAFPEVFVDVPAERRGFDAIVGNPPFLGGQKTSGVLGADYLAALQAWDGRAVKGSCDLAGRFLLRADLLLAPGGHLGYVTTNTLLEGDTLTVGLLQLAQRGVDVPRGTSTRAWPSASANLSVVDVWTSKAERRALAVLDGEPVPNLGVDLQPFLRETGRPGLLEENEDIAFQGSTVLGLGFTLTAEEAAAMVTADPRNVEVLAPYIIGADLNRRSDTSASRWVINFRNWDLLRAERYTRPFEQVVALVKPERDRKADPGPRETWWRFTRPRGELYEAIADLDHVLAISLVGNVLLPVRVPTGPVFAHACGVFALHDFGSLALLSSSVHQAWAIRYTSTMRTDIRYAPSDVFLTLPRPDLTPTMQELGAALDGDRREIMLRRQLGLTKLYNLVHDPAYSDPDVLRLRDLHAEIDVATLAAYGWSDLDPQVGHHPTKIGTRWTVSPTARFELLDRLLVENHARAARQ